MSEPTPHRHPPRGPHRHRVALVVTIVIGIWLAALMVAAWPATASPDPTVTPTTYGPPGPNGGPR